ncbi:MAG TPA: zf-HC2 domain-containing protein [Acidimicrobiales bacterium]
MTRVTCAEVREAAPDLALGLVTGRERAAYLDHLERCGPCRADVSALAVTADDVLLAGPRAEPPPGFRGRVLERLGAAGAFAEAGPGADRQPSGAGFDAEPGAERRRTGRRGGGPAGRPPRAGRSGPRVLAAAAAVLVAVGLVAGGLAVLAGRGGDGADPATAGATAAMRTGTGRLVGEATVRGDDPAVVTVDLPGWGELVERYGDPGGRYWLAVELDDGSRTLNRIPPDESAWEVPLRAAAADVAAVSVVDAGGRAWCTGRFPAPA